MNIIYLLTNLTNGRKYIGQKVECRIENIDGIDTIINNRTELPYYGSSSNILMIEDMKSCKFKAEILEQISNKKEICKREDYWIRFYNAVESEDFYNLSYPLDYSKRDFQNSVKNEFGELYKEFAANESAISKRINSAKKVGFNTLEDFYLDVYQKIKIEKNLTKIAREYNVERHTISRLVQEVNIEKFYSEIQNYSKRTYNKIVDYRVKGASIKKIGELLNLEFATILYYISTNNYKKQNYLVSNRKGLTEDELGYKIMEKFLKGEGLNKISKNLQLNKNQTTRSFHRFIRKHIEINDFNGIQMCKFT